MSLGVGGGDQLMFQSCYCEVENVSDEEISQVFHIKRKHYIVLSVFSTALVLSSGSPWSVDFDTQSLFCSRISLKSGNSE